MTKPHVAVIGAGPAGAACAVLLARQGVSVTLLERARFPRVKVCGEYISPAGVPALSTLLARNELERFGATACDLMALDLPRRPVEFKSPAPGVALSRATLDTELVNLARSLGVCVLQPRTVRSVRYEEHCVELTTNDDTVQADAVVHADGAGTHDPAGPTPTAARLLGHKCHLRTDAVPEPIRGVRIRPGAGGYVGLIAVENGLTTCALVAKAALTKARRGDADAMLQDLWPEYDPAWRASPWKASPVPRSPYIEPGHPRSVRLGNAAAAVDPVGGEGIGLALWSAAEFAESLAEADGDFHQKLAAARSHLRRAYRRRLRWRRPACRFAAGVVMRPRLAAAAATLCSTAGLRAFYALSGKPAQPLASSPPLSHAAGPT